MSVRETLFPNGIHNFGSLWLLQHWVPDGVCGIRHENDLWRATETQFQGTLTWLCIHLHHHHLFISVRENNFQTEFTILVHCGFCSIGFLMVFVVSGMKMISGGHPKHDSQGTLTWLCIHLHHHHLFISARENHRKTISFGLAYPKNVNKTTPKTSVAKK